eukprot:2462508-Pyramimonas_sp.AAC.1
MVAKRAAARGARKLGIKRWIVYLGWVEVRPQPSAASSVGGGGHGARGCSRTTGAHGPAHSPA